MRTETRQILEQAKRDKGIAPESISSEKEVIKLLNLPGHRIEKDSPRAWGTLDLPNGKVIKYCLRWSIVDFYDTRKTRKQGRRIFSVYTGSVPDHITDSFGLFEYDPYREEGLT